MSDDDESVICPITQEVFRDPVIAEDGRLYEREAITRWINEHGTSPFTRQALDVNRLQPDDEVRKRAEQRRRLSVSYNREFDRVQLPPVRPPPNIRFKNFNHGIPLQRETVHRRTFWQSIRCRCCSQYCPAVTVCICKLLCVMIPSIIALIVTVTAKAPQNSSFTTREYSTPSPVCSIGLNYNFSANPCLSSFTNLRTIYSMTCNNFTYDSHGFGFVVSSSVITIIFAFQQSSGYWDIDNIRLQNSTSNRNLFQNGDFETGSLSPHYSQCQSTGNISNSSQLNGRYCYSDGTQGRFGYLLQTVPTTSLSRYYLDFYLRNRGASNASFALLFGI